MMLNRIRTLAFSAAWLVTVSSLAQSDSLERASQLELQGRFTHAAAVLTNALASQPLPATQRKQLEFELDRLERIRKDYSLTKEALFEALQKSVRDLTPEEFDRWIAEGRFDTRTIDGAHYFMDSSVSNLYFRYPELGVRRINPRDPSAYEKSVWQTCVAIKQAARENGPYVLPKRFHVTMTVTARPEAAPAGQIIRAWLPVPRRYPFQDSFSLISSAPAHKHLDGEQSPIRSVYLEQPARGSQPTEFKIEYTYATRGVHFDLNPAKARLPDRNNPASKPYLGAAPHVVFTADMKALSQKLAGREKNPLLKAKAFYDWIAENIRYSYALEYSTIRNISDYCLKKGYGDCGQEALLFITLCRLNGIPARWQSGWKIFPEQKTIHDWCEIYLEPWGWMPVDPYMGIFAAQYARTLSPEQRREVRDFYFGGLDPYRMAANSDHNQELNPPKRSFRSDDVDFQRGELEFDNRNIYFDKYSYRLEWTEIKSPAAK